MVKNTDFDVDLDPKISKTGSSKTGVKNKGLHLIMASFDGHVYIIDGITKCAERIDVGEHIYTTPLLGKCY